MTNPFTANAPAAAPAAAPVATPPAAPAPAPTAAPTAAPVATPPAAAAPTAAPVAGGFSTPTAAATAPAKDPFGRPKPPSTDNISEHVNQGVLVRPRKYVTNVSTQFGVTDAVEADWIVLTGPDAGTIQEGMIFQRPLVRALEDHVGVGFMVGVLVRGQAKQGQSAPYIFADPNDDVMALARQAAEAHNWI